MDDRLKLSKMKYPEKQYSELLKAIPVLLESYGLGVNDVDSSNMGLLNTIHCRVFQQKNYTDDNANVKFIDGKRLFPIDESFKLYPDGCNDNHVETAMKSAFKDLKTL